MSRCGALILAAGGSSRFGRPKQLLPFGGEPLIARITRTVLLSQAKPVGIVLGSHASLCESALAGFDVRIIHNPRWEEGMSTSIQAGVAAIGTQVDALVIALCDQPFVSAELIDRLISTDAPIAACS